jgi:hypothetical protein
MKLFFYKPIQFNPLLLLITKLSSRDEYAKLEAITKDIFQILIDHKLASEENILIFSVIKDYEKSTINLILASTKSNPTLTKRCYNETKFINEIIVESLKKMDSELYLDIQDHKIVIVQQQLNLMAFSKFYYVR